MLCLRTAALVLPAAALWLAGCERPFVPLDPPLIEVVSPDLSEVFEADQVAIVLRVTAPRGVTDVTVNGQPTSQGAGDDLYLDTLQIAEGLNMFVVEARGDDGNVARDTLFALRLALQTGITPSGDLPEARAYHSATALADGSVLVAGGIGPDALVRAQMYRLTEVAAFTFNVSDAGVMATGRAGHSTNLLADGRVLVVGGTSSASPVGTDDFVTQAEIFDPTTGSSTLIPGRGDPVARTRHLSFLLTSGGRRFVYIVGGRGTLGSDVGTPASVVIAELRGAPGADTLVTLTPPGGAGVLTPVTAPAGAMLPPRAGNPRALVAGLYAPEGLAVLSRLVFLPGSSFYPFQVLEQSPQLPDDPRGEAAAAPFDPTGGMVLLLGGRDAAGVVSARVDVYSDAADRFFRVPLDRVALRVSRFGHTATLLPSGRIGVVGGFPVPGSPTAATEVIFHD
jgi:hypothetical protein